MKISILVPTRGRPKLLRRMWKKCLSLATNPEEVEYILYIDLKIFHMFRLTEGDTTNQIRRIYRKKMLKFYDNDELKDKREGDIRKLKDYIKNAKKSSFYKWLF